MGAQVKLLVHVAPPHSLPLTRLGNETGEPLTMKAGEESRAKQMAASKAQNEVDMQQMQQQREQQQEMEEKKRMMIRQLLEPQAFERLNTVGLVKPERQQ